MHIPNPINIVRMYEPVKRKKIRKITIIVTNHAVNVTAVVTSDVNSVSLYKQNSDADLMQVREASNGSVSYVYNEGNSRTDNKT